MIRMPQYEKRNKASPSPLEPEPIPDGTEVRCMACNEDLFGIFQDNELQLKYKGRSMRMTHGQVQVICRSCGYETQINLAQIKTRVYQYQEDPEVLISKEAHDLIIKKGLKPRNIVGTGKDGKILLADVKKYLAARHIPLE